MATEIRWEIGWYYRTRAGRKARLVWRTKGGLLIFVMEDIEGVFWTYADGRYSKTGMNDFDIMAEWREPRQWDVGIYQEKGASTNVVASLCVGEQVGYELVARVTVTEGEGLE
jgi:hypothetical protein